MKKGLQKLTEIEVKINELMKKQRITEEDLIDFSREERDKLGDHLTELINKTTGEDRDYLLYQIDEITPKGFHNQLWENNHVQITTAISNLMAEYGRMPSKNEIAAKCKLSRQTIYKHIKEYSAHPLYAEEMKAYKFMADKVLAKVFQYAINGEVKAARLYFEVLGVMGKPGQSNSINTQNNYIQINGTVLSQETIKHLNPEQLNNIESILKAALPELVKSKN